jgi:hypothetical protein
MNLHPDERPDSIEHFRQSLLGDRPVLMARSSTRPLRLKEILRSTPERTLVWVTIGLTVITLLTALMK